MQISEMHEQLGLFSTDKGTAHDYLCGYYDNEFKDLRELSGAHFFIPPCPWFGMHIKGRRQAILGA